MATPSIEDLKRALELLREQALYGEQVASFGDMSKLYGSLDELATLRERERVLVEDVDRLSAALEWMAGTCLAARPLPQPTREGHLQLLGVIAGKAKAALAPRRNEEDT